MTVIAVKQDNQAFVLNEDNQFVCAHVNMEFEPEIGESNWVCDDCEMYAPAYPEGIDEDGHLEYRAPEMWEWQ